MQIKPILAAVGAVACMSHEWTAVAADAPHPSGENSSLQAMADDKAGAKTEERDMKPAATVSVRNTRPRTDHHKDVRACLDAGKNEAITDGLRRRIHVASAGRAGGPRAMSFATTPR